MKLKLSRSQKTGGMMNKTVVFCLDARTELTPDETNDVKKYRLGNQVIYNSEASKKHLDNTTAGLNSGGLGGIMKGAVGLAMAKMSLNITIDSLVKGHHIEAKDMDEALGAEEAIKHACESMKTYLDAASTFDGREQVIEF
ncbi:MAG: hypothetical protein AB2809_21710 [Candidatus Thiodiazotropha sp.]